MKLQQEIQGWLDKIAAIREEIAQDDPDGYYEANPPRPPATEERIRQAEEQLGIPLPEEYKELLRVCDGWPGMVNFEVDLFGTEELMNPEMREWIEEQRQSLLEYLPEELDWSKSVFIGEHREGYGDLLLLQPVPDGWEWIWTELGDTHYVQKRDVVGFLREVYRFYEELDMLEKLHEEIGELQQKGWFIRTEYRGLQMRLIARNENCPEEPEVTCRDYFEGARRLVQIIRERYLME